MSYGLYKDELAMAIHLYKFKGIKRLSGPLGKLLLGFDLEGVDAVIPVPLSVKGLRERGFNQSLLLAKCVSDSSGIPLIIDGLVKTSDTPPQIGLPAKKRRTNLKGVFEAARDFRDRRLLLVDDVMTTGATANECSLRLRKAGAEDVMVLTLARAGIL
jgi:ComF family protein